MLTPKLVDKLKARFPGLEYRIVRQAMLGKVLYKEPDKEYFTYEGGLIVKSYPNTLCWEHMSIGGYKTTFPYLTQALSILIWRAGKKRFPYLPNLPHHITIFPRLVGYNCGPKCTIYYDKHKLQLNYNDDLFSLAIGAYKHDAIEPLLDKLEETVWGNVFEEARLGA